MFKTKQQSAFSMVELIFAIVILGIVSSLGAKIITQVFESYVVQRAQYRANLKTELTLQQIANRLRYAIPDTIGARLKIGTAFVPIVEVTDANMKVLQWVGYDGDSFEAITSGTNSKPGWSGFCDINASFAADNDQIVTPGSNLSLADAIIKNLSGGNKEIKDANIFFANLQGTAYGVSSGTDETIALDNPLPNNTIISERYKLAWTSYALEVDTRGDLYLHYNFAPDRNTTINGSKSSLLLRDVTNFRFKYAGGAFRLKICKKERIGTDANITIHACKEKVVF